MRTTTIAIPAIAIMALCAAAIPASADQQRDRSNRGREVAVTRSAPRDTGAARDSGRETQQRERTAPVQRSEAPRRESSAPVQRSEAPRRELSAPVQRTEAPRRELSAPVQRSEAPRRESNIAIARGEDVRRGASNAPPTRVTESRRPGSNVAVPRTYDPRANAGRGYEQLRDRRLTGPSRTFMAFQSFFGRLPDRHYSFRPRGNLGFGLWLGYSIGFPLESYLYSRTSTYREYGALSFEVDPADAYVYVDGYYVGAAGDFGPYERPLTLRVGPHRIEVEAPGFRTVVFDVDVLPGQLIPFRGQLEYFER